MPWSPFLTTPWTFPLFSQVGAHWLGCGGCTGTCTSLKNKNILKLTNTLIYFALGLTIYMKKSIIDFFHGAIIKVCMLKANLVIV